MLTRTNVEYAGENQDVVPQQEWGQHQTFVGRVLAIVVIQLWLTTAVYRLCSTFPTIIVSSRPPSLVSRA